MAASDKAYQYHVRLREADALESRARVDPARRKIIEKKACRNVRANADLTPRALPTCHNHARKADSSTRDDTDDTSPSSYKTMTSFPLDTSTETGVTSAGRFLSLPRDVISHILRSEFLPEPKDLGRLRAVCKGLRDAVDLTGRKIKKLSDVLAAEGGYLSLLKDRHSRGVLKYKYKYLVCAAAARNGDLKELKALRADDYPWYEETCAYAAEHGHLEVLKWAHANGCPWDEATCWRAAMGGHLEVLQWARANGCPWSEWTCACAAKGGHLEVLQWARANGCPWDEQTCSGAASKGYVET